MDGPMAGPEIGRDAPRSRADPLRGRPAGRLPDRPAGADDLRLRDRCDRRAAAGRAADERRVRGARRRSSTSATRRAHPRGRHRRDLVRACRRRVHPAGRRRAHRDLEHGRDDPDRRLLRPRAAHRDLVLCGDRDHLRRRRPCDRQLLDHGRDPRRRVRALAPIIGVDPVITAGAVISGAYFGDKMTPISETTVLVPSMVGNVTTNQHIGAMIWTSGPAVVIAIVLFTFLGLTGPEPSPVFDPTRRRPILAGEFNISLINLLPMVLLIVLSVRRFPPFLSIFGVALFAGVLASVHAAPGDRGVHRQARPGRAADQHRGALHGDGERLRLQLGHRPDRRALLARRDGRMLTTHLARPRRAQLRRGHGARRLPRAPRPARAHGRSLDGHAHRVRRLHVPRPQHPVRRPVRLDRDAEPRSTASSSRNAGSRRGCCRAPSRTPGRSPRRWSRGTAAARTWRACSASRPSRTCRMPSSTCSAR